MRSRTSTRYDEGSTECRDTPIKLFPMLHFCCKSYTFKDNVQSEQRMFQILLLYENVTEFIKLMPVERLVAVQAHIHLSIKVPTSENVSARVYFIKLFSYYDVIRFV